MVRGEAPDAAAQPLYQEAIDKIREVVDAANEPGDLKKGADYAPASDWLRGVAKEAGLDLEGVSHGIDADAIRHAKNEHGDEALEASRGQIALTDEDFEKLPEVTGEPDRVVFGGTSRSNRLDTIAYVKRLEDGTVAHVEEVRTGRKRLAAVTMWKHPAGTDVDDIADNLRRNVRNGGGRVKPIVVKGPGADKGGEEGLSAADGGTIGVTKRAEPAPNPAGQEADEDILYQSGRDLGPDESSHLAALYTRYANEKARLKNAATDEERNARTVWVRGVEKEINSERKFLGLSPDTFSDDDIDEDELLRELRDPDVLFQEPLNRAERFYDSPAMAEARSKVEAADADGDAEGVAQWTEKFNALRAADPRFQGVPLQPNAPRSHP